MSRQTDVGITWDKLSRMRDQIGDLSYRMREMEVNIKRLIKYEEDRESRRAHQNKKIESSSHKPLGRTHSEKRL